MNCKFLIAARVGAIRNDPHIQIAVPDKRRQNEGCRSRRLRGGRNTGLLGNIADAFPGEHISGAGSVQIPVEDILCFLTVACVGAANRIPVRDLRPARGNFDSFVTGWTVNTVLAVVGVHCIPGHAVFIIQEIRFKGADRVTGSGGIDVNDACSEQNKSGAILDSRHTVVPTDILDKVLSLWIPEAICKRVVSVDCGFDGACCAVIAVSESLQTLLRSHFTHRFKPGGVKCLRGHW